MSAETELGLTHHSVINVGMKLFMEQHNHCSLLQTYLHH